MCVESGRGCEGGEAYVASVTRCVNKSRAEGLNRALFCLIQILPESTFILLIKYRKRECMCVPCRGSV